MMPKFLRPMLLAGLACALLLTAGAVADEPDDLPGLFQRAQGAMQVEDYETAYLTARIILSHEEFDSLPAYARGDLYGLAGAAAFFLDDDNLQEALGYLDEAERLGSANPVVFMIRSMAHMANDDVASSAEDIMRAGRLERGMVNMMRSSEIAPLVTMLSLSEDAQAQAVYPRFVDYLIKRWDSEHPFDDTQLLSFHAARIAIKNGDLITASRHVDEIELPQLRVRVQVGRDFEPFWIEDPSEVRDHIRAGARLSSQRFQDLADDHPGYIEPVLNKAQALAQLGRSEEVRVLLAATREQVLDGVLINDVSEQMAWLLNDMATNAYSLGDLDGAIALMTEAAQLSEFESANISQRANLAMMLALAGEEERALAELDQIDIAETSDYGEGVVLTARICANHYLGETAGIESDLDRFEALGRITARLRQFTFACLDDLDRGASLLISRLEDPLERADALAELQIYMEIDTEYQSPGRAVRKAYEDALLAREDVAAAIERAGRRLDVGIVY